MSEVEGVSSITVGERFFINMGDVPDGVYFEYQGGYGFLIFRLWDPTQAELDGLSGDITLGLYRSHNVLFIESKTELFGYADAPYSCRLAQEPVELPDHTAPVGQGMSLVTVIVDEHNIVRGMRYAVVSNQFMKTIMVPEIKTLSWSILSESGVLEEVDCI